MRISEIIRLIHEAYVNDLTLSVTYTNAQGESNDFDICNITINTEFGSQCIDKNGYIDAFCLNQNDIDISEEKTFKISRFDYIELL